MTPRTTDYGLQDPGQALVVLADRLRAEDTVISPHVVEPEVAPEIGLLVAAGPHGRSAPGEYALVVESVREGYLLHFGTARLLAGQDDDLSLLAGDYLYALGLERLAALGDDPAVRELSDLISLVAQCHAEGRPELAAALWLAAAVAVGCGGDARHEEAKAAARALGEDAAEALIDSAVARSSVTGVTEALERARDAIDFDPSSTAERG